MRTVRIFQAGDYQKDQEVYLSPEASHHVAVVLRMHIGDSLTLFCGDNREFAASIQALKKKQVLVCIHAVKPANRESPLQLHLAQAISKGERMDFVMQKAVELGVSSIVPILTQRCVVRLDAERMEKKRRLWQSIVVSACEQSGRNSLPTVYPIQTLEAYLRQDSKALKLLLDPESTHSWREYRDFNQAIHLLVGPEGGLSSEEITLATSQGFQRMSLGPRILRTETAALSAISILQAMAGDL